MMALPWNTALRQLTEYAREYCTEYALNPARGWTLTATESINLLLALNPDP